MKNHLVITDSEHQRVLTTFDCQSKTWILPSCSFDDTPSNVVDSRCFKYLHNLLGVASEQLSFQVVVQLLPLDDNLSVSYYYNPGQAKRATLIHCEPSISKVLDPLPPIVRWTPMSQLLNVVQCKTYEYFYASGALTFFFRSQLTDYIPSDHRSHPRWLYQMSQYFMNVARSKFDNIASNVQRVPRVTSAQLFKLRCSSKWLYLKCPRPGVTEIKVHCFICSNFPHLTVPLIDFNEDLNCIIQEEFNYIGLNEFDNDETYRQALDLLFSLHKQSVPHVDLLKDLGVHDMSPTTMLSEWDSTFENPLIALVKDKESINTPLEKLSNMLTQLCIKLAKSNLAATLIHGDFCSSNFARRRDNGKLLLFDWEFACIAHPFCDLHHGCILHKKTLVCAWLDRWGFEKDSEQALDLVIAGITIGWLVAIRLLLVVHDKTAADNKPYVERHVAICFRQLYKSLQTIEKDLAKLFSHTPSCQRNVNNQS